MIRALKIKITAMLSLLLSVILISVLVAVNILSYTSFLQESDAILERIAESDGIKAPPGSSPLEESEIYRSAQFYSVLVSKNGAYIGIQNDSSLDISRDIIYKNADTALASGRADGRIGDISYKIKPAYYGSIIVFMDNGIALSGIRDMRLNSILFGGMGLILIILLSFFIASLIVLPVKQTFRLQKEFIADAGHELKTPLTVIKANSDILASSIGENKWVSNINSECDRMSSLVGRLLQLSSIEESPKRNFAKIVLSDIVQGAALPFECVAFERGLTFETVIEDNVSFVGDKENLAQLVSILTDNGIKYSSRGGKVCVSLTKKSNRIILSVSNTGEEISAEEKAHIFDRFYRADKARSSNGSYGLGLSIAKAIAEQHGGHIEVSSKNGINEFCVRF